jgi:hypothetical protein
VPFHFLLELLLRKEGVVVVLRWLLHRN